MAGGRGAPLGGIATLLLLIAVVATVYWTRDAFAPIADRGPVTIDPKTAESVRSVRQSAPPAATTAVAPPTEVPEPQVHTRTPSAPNATATTQVGPSGMSGAELEALMDEYRAEYRKRFKPMAPGTAFVLQLRAGTRRDVEFKRASKNSVSVAMNGATMEFPRRDLAARTRARIFEDDYAEYMTQRRIRSR